MVHSQLRRGDDKELMLRPMLRIPKLSQPQSPTCIAHFCVAHDAFDHDHLLSCRYVTNERASFPASSRAKDAVNEGLWEPTGAPRQGLKTSHTSKYEYRLKPKVCRELS